MTLTAQEALPLAWELAGSAGQPQIERDHLLNRLVDQKGGVIPSVLRKLNV